MSTPTCCHLIYSYMLYQSETWTSNLLFRDDIVWLLIFYFGLVQFSIRTSSWHQLQVIHDATLEPLHPGRFPVCPVAVAMLMEHRRHWSARLLSFPLHNLDKPQALMDQRAKHYKIRPISERWFSSASSRRNTNMKGEWVEFTEKLFGNDVLRVSSTESHIEMCNSYIGSRHTKY